MVSLTQSQIKQMLSFLTNEQKKEIQCLADPTLIEYNLHLSHNTAKKWKYVCHRFNLSDEDLSVLIDLDRDCRNLMLKYFNERYQQMKGLAESLDDAYKRFDALYDDMKDSLGFVRLSLLRQQMGMSQEEFYGKFRDYIIAHYQLIDGDEEGIIRNGKRYGIIRKKVD